MIYQTSIWFICIVLTLILNCWNYLDLLALSLKRWEFPRWWVEQNQNDKTGKTCLYRGLSWQNAKAEELVNIV